MIKRLFIPISIAFFCVFCSNNDENNLKKFEDFTEAKTNGFVYLKDNKFYLYENEYFPLSVNYKVSLRFNDTIMWPSPYTGYHDIIIENSLNRDSCLILLKSDLQMIKDIGFNSLRIIGIGEVLDTLQDKSISKYISAIDDLFTLTKQYDLKIILLLPMFPKKPQLFEKYKPLLTKFSDNNNILAYDFFNEPVYFDSLDRERTKEEVYDITKEWSEYINTNAPNQLLTIGLTGPREVNEWDPNIINVDFLSFHPYEYADNMVLRDIYWIYKNVKKPWIIGETSLPADNDSISYEEQKEFAEKVLKQTINCGGIGFSWWQYKDVKWGNFHSNFMGVINRYGITSTSDKNLKIIGTPKDVVEVFKDFKYNKTNDIIKPENYYNCYKHSNFRITGKIIDEDTKLPINDAVITGWYADWSKSFITFTKEDGSFELNGEYELHHFKISSTKYNSIWKNIKNDGKIINNQNTPTIDIGTQELVHIDFL